MFGKTHIKIMFLMTATNLVLSCLVTNCPRGGKRGNLETSLPSTNAVSSGLKKCKLCSPGKEICLGIYCASEVSCREQGYCVSQEVCCSKKFCKLLKSCQSDFHEKKHRQSSSVILTKLLMYFL